jgi:hypothetical protein
MLKRDKLESILRRISDDEFAVIWEKTYGYLPQGTRAELAKDFAAEQYDKDLDGCIKTAESSLKHAPKPKPKSKSNWLPPR